MEKKSPNFPVGPFFCMPCLFSKKPLLPRKNPGCEPDLVLLINLVFYFENPATNLFTAWKVLKYGVISGPNTGKYRPEIAPYMDTFHAAIIAHLIVNSLRNKFEFLVEIVEGNSILYWHPKLNLRKLFQRAGLKFRDLLLHSGLIVISMVVVIYPACYSKYHSKTANHREINNRGLLRRIKFKQAKMVNNLFL